MSAKRKAISSSTIQNNLVMNFMNCYTMVENAHILLKLKKINIVDIHNLKVYNMHTHESMALIILFINTLLKMPKCLNIHVPIASLENHCWVKYKPRSPQVN